MKRSTSGFTIVELLIVIVVIAILAAITVVAYNGIQDRAQNSARMSEVKAWDKLFKLYAAEFGRLPAMPNGGYCLGTGFPDADSNGTGDCRDLGGGATQHSTNATLNTELARAGSLPSGTRVQPISGVLGPYATYVNASYIQLTVILKGSTCPDGYSSSYIYPPNRAVMCNINIEV